MLSALSIRDVVLIEKLDIEFGDGLTGLTGETGAGKSILLDALGLALGSRAEQRLIRKGAQQAAVTATFDEVESIVRPVLDEHGLDPAVGEEGLILRRVLSSDGKSRAFVNGEAVTIGVLKALGERLGDIHGQFDNQRLLEPAQHRGLLDSYGGLGNQLAKVGDAWREWQKAEAAVTEAETRLAKAREDEAFLRHAVDEINALDPRQGEEQELADRRTMLMNAEKVTGALSDTRAILSEPREVADILRHAAADVERLHDTLGGGLENLLGALDRAANETDEAMAEIDRLGAAGDLDPRELEQVEERLFALRALARKHGVEVGGLEDLRTRLSADLEAIEDGGASLDALRAKAKQARSGYETVSAGLTAGRTKAGKALSGAVMGELPQLKLGDARFEVSVEPLDEEAWSALGRDRITFSAAANPGADPGPIGKVLSGGELARFMLALKVVVAKADPVPTLVFDEVDSGIGGATADAVGERLSTLGAVSQVLVVTHSPQVAARADRHLRVAKIAGDDVVRTLIEPLDDDARCEEIARMLSAAEVTEEARAQAAKLLAGRGKTSRGAA